MRATWGQALRAGMVVLGRTFAVEGDAGKSQVRDARNVVVSRRGAKRSNKDCTQKLIGVKREDNHRSHAFCSPELL